MNDIQGIPIMHHRRNILLGGLRCGGLLALGGVASLLGWRSLHGTCLRNDPCGACPLFTACGLPKALDAKTPNPASPPAAGANPKTRSKDV
ncbi:MAG: hypothetical protein NTV46_13870 [Verrucomicrobia bacterium]|nr:hypothetical protein [Verrucomicrobiota bacterium]